MDVNKALGVVKSHVSITKRFVQNRYNGIVVMMMMMMYSFLRALLCCGIRRTGRFITIDVRRVCVGGVLCWLAGQERTGITNKQTCYE